MSRTKVVYPAFSRTQVVDRLSRICVALAKKLPISLVILFGSYASGRYTAGSDIDVLIVYRGEPRKDAYRLVVNEIGLPRLEPRIYTETEFQALMTGAPKFAEILEKEGIVIAGSPRKGRTLWSREARIG